jgi:peptidoglycan/xylan/chitin deacetylase (PgdA/CDA1 family)/glycosyltransferase involved in cell wall biosynthesis
MTAVAETGTRGFATQTQPRFSVIICTYQRREIVLRTLAALAKQQYDGVFEVVVVVDGSTDGTGAAIRSLATPFTLHVLEHPNVGASRSRNRGAEIAEGELLLFIDDDMEADPRLLAELDRSHRAGADVAFGRFPLHPSSPETILSEAVARWADQVAETLRTQGRPPSGDQIYTGQISIRREVFSAVGGFDVRFAGAGSYGNEDLDIGYRIVARGFNVVFNPNAVTYQYYATPAKVNLRQYRQMGHADVAFVRKHPELSRHLFDVVRNETREHAKLRDVVLRWPRLAGALVALLRIVVPRRIDGGNRDRRTEWLFFTMRTVEYWRGVSEAGGIPQPQAVRVLCYHAITDLSDDAVLADYGVPPAEFRDQMAWLRKAGYRFIRGEELTRMLAGEGGVPRRAVLVTFDDGYRDLLTGALPALEEVGVPAVTFVVTSSMGQTNKWDEAAGARSLPLMGRDELARCRRAGVEIGAHSRTHPALVELDAETLESEIAGSVADLEAAGLGRPALFAYPAGEHSAAVRRAARAAGLHAAFTTDPGLASPGDDPFALRRIEILSTDRGLRFRLKVWTGGRVPLSVAALRAARWRRSRRALQGDA